MKETSCLDLYNEEMSGKNNSIEKIYQNARLLGIEHEIPIDLGSGVVTVCSEKALNVVLSDQKDKQYTYVIDKERNDIYISFAELDEENKFYSSIMKQIVDMIGEDELGDIQIERVAVLENNVYIMYTPTGNKEKVNLADFEMRDDKLKLLDITEE